MNSTLSTQEATKIEKNYNQQSQTHFNFDLQLALNFVAPRL